MNLIYLRFLSLFAAIALLAAAATGAEDDPNAEPTDRGQKDFDKVAELFKAGQHEEGLRYIDSILGTYPENSMDRAYFYRQQVLGYMTLRQPLKVIEALERILVTKRFPEKNNLEFRYYLAQLNLENSRDPQAAYWMSEWRKAGGQENYDQLLLEGTIFYQLGKFKDAMEIVTRSFKYTPRLEEPQLRLATGCYQEVGTILKADKDAKEKEQPGSAEAKAAQQAYNDNLRKQVQMLEFLVQLKPAEINYWQQLLQTYLAFEPTADYLNAITTMERAMKLGHFSKASDYYTLFTLYYNAEQYRIAAQMLDDGMQKKLIENKQESWEQLFYCWQFLKDENRAIEVLERGAKTLPNGDLDVMRAQVLFQQGRLADSFEAAKMAFNKGQARNWNNVIVLYAQLALELRKLEDLDKALKSMEDIPALAQDRKILSDALKVILEDR